MKERLPGVEEPPLTVEAGLEVIEGSRRVEFVQRKIRGRELPLRQLRPEHVDRIIAPGEVLMEIEARIPRRLGLLQPRAGRFGVIFVGAKRGILLQCAMHRPLQSHRRTFRCFLCTQRSTRQRKCQHGRDRYEFPGPEPHCEPQPLPRTSAVSAFSHAVSSSRISEVVSSFALFATIAPTLQYFSSES